MNTFQATHRITTASQTIEVMLTDNGAAYTAAEWEASDTADYERNGSGEWTFQGQPFAGSVEAIDGTYRIAYMIEATGEFEVVETFTAADDAAANAYAEAHHDGQWYVLNAAGRNINAGIDG